MLALLPPRSGFLAVTARPNTSTTCKFTFWCRTCNSLRQVYYIVAVVVVVVAVVYVVITLINRHDLAII